jgi:2-dehydro-3-deoxygluconokinase
MIIVCIGECMLELSGRMGTAARLGYGGDVLNTTVYLARLGLAPAFLTALGEDPYSEELLACWRAEGVSTQLVVRSPSKLPGLYAIRTDPAGERRFYYWRSDSAARALFSSAGVDAALAVAERARLLYLSGITLSLYPKLERARLVELARRVREQGGDVAFDPNFRPGCWPSPEAAREAITELAPYVSVALPTLSDEAALWGDRTAEAAAAHWLALGAREVVVKLGAEGAWLSGAGVSEHVPAIRIVVRDSTAAGDAFDAGYLAARLRSTSPRTAASFAHELAAIVVQHRGAIAPVDATRALCETSGRQRS